jgi:translocation and assembly module TamB
MELNQLSLTRGNAALWNLQQPCNVKIRRNESGEKDNPAPATWAIDLDGLQLRGPGRELDLEGTAIWPTQGAVNLRSQGLGLTDFSEFVVQPLEGLATTQLALNARWNDGPMDFQLTANGHLPTLAGRQFNAGIDLKGNAEGVVADGLVRSADNTEIVRLHATLPLLVTPKHGAKGWHLDEQKLFTFSANTQENTNFWDWAGRLLGVQVTKPEVEIQLHGTLAAAHGVFQAQTSLVSPLRASTNDLVLPPLANVHIQGSIDPTRVRFDNFTATLADHPIRITGEMPVQPQLLMELLTNAALPDWRQGRATLELTNAHIEHFTGYLPAVFSPLGTFAAHLSLAPGGNLKGELQIDGAATKPVNLIAPVRDIKTTLRFDGRRATLEMFDASIGGQQVRATGQLDLPAAGEPHLALRLQGENVPLVHQQGLLLRSDIDLQLTVTSRDKGILTGNLALRDGLYLQDLKSLVPTESTEAYVRIPYYGVRIQPFAGWKLNVKVEGNRFMRVRTPYFKGQVSAYIQIEGDFEEPITLGEVQVNSGKILFPFGTLQLNQARASLTSDNPFEPQLFADASSRLYGYNVKMSVSGSARNPLLYFSSTPPLTSEQILLMLASGDVPRDDLNPTSGRRAGTFAFYLGKDIVARWIGDESSAERLTLRSAEDISREGRSTYSVEYKLSEDWSVVGEYDRFNALNAGLKWRIFSR